MSTRLILARHGNTFNPEDTPLWVGARSDFPLVAKGLAQAALLADGLELAHIRPDKIITGPLQRTRQMAATVTERLKLPPAIIDTRLTEIDYGTWEAQSTEDIIAAGGCRELEEWNKISRFPTQPGWSPPEAQIISDTAAILAELTEDTVLIISSNGILRFFARAALNAADYPDRKVATGQICVMERGADEGWRITHWNQPPAVLSLRRF